jgi:hypothetical protein
VNARAEAHRVVVSLIPDEWEEWRPLADTDWYEVSSLGRVRSWRKKGSFGGRLAQPLMLKTHTNRGGYRIFVVNANSGRRTARVHREACLAFHGAPPFEGAVVRHLDGDSLNNMRENLAWGSTVDNAKDARRHGTWVRGEKQGNAVLREADIPEIRRLVAAGVPRKEVAARLGVTVYAIHHVVSRETWAWVA